MDMLPNHWKYEELGNYISEVLEKNFSNRKLKVMALTKYNGIVDSLQYFRNQVFSKNLKNYKIIKKNQFAYSTIHLNEGSIGYLKDKEEALLSPLYKVFKIDDNNLNAYYLYNLLKSNFYINLCSKLVEGSVNRRGSISFKRFSKIKIPIPPYKEQKKIASILSTVDEQIENTENLINSYTLLKKGLMQTLLTKGIGHTEFKKTEIGEIPANWEIIGLDKLGFTFNGLQGKNINHFGKGKPYIPYKNIFNNSRIDINYFDYVYIEENEIQNKVKYGDIFFTTSSETPDEVGISSILLDDIDELYLNSFCFGYRLNNFNIVKPEFLRYLLRGNYIRKRMSILAQGSTRFNLSKKEVIKIKIPIPAINEQIRIATILSELDEFIKLQKCKKQLFKVLRKGLMQRLLTSKIRVKV